MRTYLANLQASTQTSYANNGKTTMLGRAVQKVINSFNVIGPPLTQFIDVQTLAGFAPSFSYYNPATNHLFCISTISATPTVALFNFNNSTGVYSYVGKLVISLGNAAATTHTIRGFKVYENGGAISILLSTTGSVLINGGTYLANGLATTDFTVGGGNTIFFANGASQKAMYFLQDSAALGSAHVATTSWGLALPQASSSAGVNTKVWQFNGTLALPQLYSWDLANTPDVAGKITNGVSAQTTLYAGTSPSAFFTMGASNNGYANGDPVVLQTGTGAVPAAFTAWVAGTAQVAATNVYFVRDLQLVSGNYYFNLATTTGGAAVTPTSSTSSFTMMRAFGTNSSLFSLKTGVLPAFTLGSILSTNCVDYSKPVSAPANTALNGQDCFAFPTSTGLYMGKISDLTSNGTTWASMTFAGVNNIGTGIDYVLPSASLGCYSGKNHANDIDRFIYVTNTSTYIVKPYQASNITTVFGGIVNNYYEGLNPITVQTGATALTNVDAAGGWLFSCSSGTGQRGIVFVDLYSDGIFANTAMISPVIQSPGVGSIFKEIDALEQLFDYTDSLNFWVRSGSTSSDAAFASANIPNIASVSGGTQNGWTLIKTAQDLSSIALGAYFQFCVTYEILTFLANTPAQVQDLKYTLALPGELSDSWAGSEDNTTPSGNSPMYVAFRLQRAYALSVPKLFVRGYDDNGNLVATFDTVSNAAAFQYSANNGTSWNALGTIPNTPFTTEIRLLVSSPPASARITWGVSES